jgi:uncharacterized protein
MTVLDATRMRYYSTQQLGIHQSMTPDGFLLVTDVPIARTGVLLYNKGEVPIDADDDGIIRIIRDPDEVFSPIAIASFAGKPICNDHPPEKVNPENWREYSVGTVLNPHRGDGVILDDDFLFADLLIQDKEAIDDVREGKREVSAGYDADYEQLRRGEGRQHLIVGNHVALVTAGRCGPRCSIQDSKGVETMATGKRPAWFDRIMQAHKTNDSEALVDTLEKVSDMLGDTWLGEASGRIKAGEAVTTSRDDMGGVHVHLHQGGSDDVADPTDTPAGAAGAGAAAGVDPKAAAAGGGNSLEELGQRVAALERAVAILAQGEEGEESDPGADPAATEATKEEGSDWSGDSKTKDKATTDNARAAVGDSTSLRGTWQELVSRAEFLAPGIKVPTFDARASARTTVDTMCTFRRKVLSESLKEDDTKAAVEQMTGGKPNLSQMTCDSIQLVFNGASELIRQANSRRTTDNLGAGMNYHAAQNASMLETVQHINKLNREKYGIKA